MRHPYFYALLLLIALPLVTSCSTMNWGQPAKAGPDISEKTEEQDIESQSEKAKESGGWLSGAFPDFSALWNKIPPPTQARRKWDEKQKRGHNSVGGLSEFYAP